MRICSNGMRWFCLLALTLALTLIGTGCATSRVDWDSRVGSYTYDDAVREMGPPDRSAQLTDGSVVADWITARGMRTASTFGGGWHPYHPYGTIGPSYVIVDPASPDRLIRLVFDPQGRLASWQRTYK